jgi:hypothetical protein
VPKEKKSGFSNTNYIATDMEGCSGVTCSEQVAAEEGKQLMAGDMIPATTPICLRDGLCSVHLYTAVASSIAPNISPELFQPYRDKFLEDAGNPTDPLEITLLENIALANLHVGRMYLKSCVATDAQAIVAFSDAAIRLASELRRTCIAVEDYRAKQLARKAQPATPEKPPAKKAPAKKDKPAPKPRKKPATNKVEKVPACLQNRMQPEKWPLPASVN